MNEDDFNYIAELLEEMIELATCGADDAARDVGDEILDVIENVEYY